MDRAIALAREAMAAGDGPAGCVCVFQGHVIAEARNRVHSTGDPTAHAELLALRSASRRLGRTDLSGLTLYTTLEPCPMCCGALLLGKVSSLVLGARYAQFRTAEWGAYSVERMVAMMGRPLEIIPGIREVECRDLRYAALQKQTRDAKSPTKQVPRAGPATGFRSWFGRRRSQGSSEPPRGTAGS